MENLLKFNPNFKIKDWCFEKLIYLKDFENYKFFNKKINHNKYKIPLDKVIGTNHYSYVGRKWIDLPYSMKRFKQYYNINNFLEFYNTKSFYEDDISYAKLNNSYFIIGGNHRTCQAKFSNIEFIETLLIEYIFDQEMYDAYKFLQCEKMIPKINSESEKYYRFNSWTIKLNGLNFYLKNFSQVNEFILQYSISNPNFFNIIYYKYLKKERLNFIKQNDNFERLKREIILHKKFIVRD